MMYDCFIGLKNADQLTAKMNRKTKEIKRTVASLYKTYLLLHNF